mmetsp:Transcript_15980/g.65722  ORF Transcript_15980/g.65722 Transcript_15980/m.65722 type:complete len:200 (-) Transcript_15980:265-864(-)
MTNPLMIFPHPMLSRALHPIRTSVHPMRTAQAATTFNMKFAVTPGHIRLPMPMNRCSNPRRKRSQRRHGSSTTSEELSSPSKLPLIESTTSPIPSDMAVIANKYVAIAKVIPGRNSARDPKPIHSNPSAADKRQFCSGIHTDSPHLNGRCSNEEFSVHSESIHTNSQHKIQTPTNRSKHPPLSKSNRFLQIPQQKNPKT